MLPCNASCPPWESHVCTRVQQWERQVALITGAGMNRDVCGTPAPHLEEAPAGEALVQAQKAGGGGALAMVHQARPLGVHVS